ncbi:MULTISPECIES: NACHT domain-containing protein [unclassified Saccharothrix]|uniref:NACHT domain-containing protein n=1 Tax=unclassified Saccharothrix TaxID=2593673 RepID=UPI00307F8743
MVGAVRVDQVGVASGSGQVYQAGRDLRVHRGSAPSGSRGHGRLVCAWLLRRYRRRVAAAAGKLPVVFGPDVDLHVSQVYLPLKAVAPGGGADGDVQDRIRRARQVVVLGDPGAGKSVLLRHTVLGWADSGGRRQVPVVLDLRRCNGTTESLERLIVEQFDRDGFPRAGRFVERKLRDGTLTVLFDGLDEVNAADRHRVSGMLRDFARRHHQAPVVVTCRTAVYDGDLLPEIGVEVRVLEWDERLIGRFLRRWPGLGDRAEDLLDALRANPGMMRLAGSPLLLTMIAYLYGTHASEHDVLPASRATFYREATRALLGRLKRTTTRFPGPVKSEVLKHLALIAHDAGSADRLTIPYAVAVAEVGALLPRLSVDASHAHEVLEEIVERSGLLLRVDGGERYQFAHLTLQEYLAAEALLADAGAVLRRFRRAPAEWRETLLLWCGLTTVDVTPLVAAVAEGDPLLAFECLAHARVVAASLDRSVTSTARAMLSEGSRPGTGHAVVRAFATVAAVPSARGRGEFRFLVDAARRGDFWAHEAACAALAATRRPDAADVLFEVGAFHHLVGMGDAAVPVLTRAAGAGSTRAVAALRDIATPAAATALAGLIWDERKTAWHAAWCLAELVTDEDVEVALGGVVPVAHVAALPWVWQPFHREGTATAWVMGRVAWLVDRTADADLPTFHVRVDHRLSLPLLALALRHAPPAAVVEAQARYRAGTPVTLSFVVGAVRAAFGGLDVPQSRLRLWNGLPADLTIGFVSGVFFGSRPFRPKDWVDVMVRRSFLATEPPGICAPILVLDNPIRAALGHAIRRPGA